MNKAVITIAVITFIAVLGLHILSTSTKTEEEAGGTVDIQTFKEKNVFGDSPKTILTELGIEDTVREYLKANIAISSFDEEVFCSYEVIGHDMDNGNLNAYLWVLCSELYISDGEIKEGAKVSAPVFVVCGEGDNGYEIVRHTLPTEGAEYTKRVADVFPPEYVKEILPEQLDMGKFDERITKLSAWNLKQAKDFYGVE